MRKFSVLILISLFFVTAAEAAGHRVGTYNIRYPAEADTAEKAWSSRRPYVVKMLRDTMNYDVVALQEVYNSSYYKYLKDNMSAYTFYMGEVYGVALAYRTSRYKCLDKGYFKLTPSPKPKDWEQLQTRWAVWVKLQDKSSGEIFYFASTHLDLYPVSIREGARIVSERMHEIAGTYPCMFAGDMNCEQFEHDPHANFCMYFGNARQMSKTAPQGSFYSFASGMNPNNASKLLDYLYVRNVEVESYFVNNSTLGRTLMPSDHMPLVCEVTILPTTRKTTHVVRTADELMTAAKTLQPNDLIYLRSGLYDLGDSTLTLANTCTIEGAPDAVLTGRNQLITGARFVSVELRDLTMRNATCPVDVFGSVVGLNGNYLKMSDCCIDSCQTNGQALVYAKECNLAIDHCIFRHNASDMHEGCVYVSGGERFTTSILNTQFAYNSAYLGSAVYYESEATAYLYGNSFIGNTAKTSGICTIRATTNSSDIRLVNNSFASNRIDVMAGFTDASVGGSAIWQEMAATGRLTLMNNTIVGNYLASRMPDGSSSSRFKSGAIHSVSGTLSLNNNIIAGNFSSSVGRGDLSIANADNLVRCQQNIFSSSDNMNCPVPNDNFLARSYAEACTQLTLLLGGGATDSTYLPTIYSYDEDHQVLALAPLITTYAGQNIAVLDATAMSAATVESDILNTGDQAGVLTLDQAGFVRNELTVPGAMEQGAEPTELNECTMHNAQCAMKNSKFLKDGRLYIQYNGRLYNPLGF